MRLLCGCQGDHGSFDGVAFSPPFNHGSQRVLSERRYGEGRFVLIFALQESQLNTIRTFLTAGALVAAFALPAATLAQTAPSDQPGVSAPQGRGGMSRMYDNLNLSPDQRQKIDALIAQYRQAHPHGSTPDPAARKALREQIFAILTPAQQSQLRAQMQARSADGGGRMMARFSQLNLTDDQKNRIENLISQFRAAHPAGSAPDRTAMQQLREQINAVLTPQQQQQLQQMRNQNQENPGS
ncbi:MAG: hypothetical protein JO135_07935 [Candidatus Eremiobacteraeota bacterium]|nr:hypothetical protein [Candidatus Eremiobacteraeota bacterium]